MSEINNRFTSGESAIKRIKTHNALKKQRIAIALMLVAIVALVAILLVVNYVIQIYIYTDVDGTEYYKKKVNGNYELCYKSGEPVDKNSDGYYQTDLGTLVQIDPSTGEHKVYAVVDIEGTEVVGYAQYVLMFKQLTYDASSTNDSSKVIKSIEVHNEFGSYTFERTTGNNFVIKDHQDAPYDKETFAQLAVACGYTISMRRLETPKTLENGKIDYAEYGLAPETRVKTVTDENGNETEVEYEYEPAWYVITTMTGESHKVTIGDMVVTGTGYYAKYEGRDTIYILGSSGFEDVMLQRVENIITPTIVYPMGMMEYFNVSDFVIYNSIDYDSIYKALEEKFGDPDKLEPGSIDEEEFLTYYDELFQKYSKKACHFSYQDLDERQGTMYSYLPYVSELEYAGGYYINSSNIDLVLYALYQTEFTGVEKLSPSDEDFAKYGLDEAPYVVTYMFKTTDASGKTVYIPNYFEVSAPNEDGIYYAYSSTYDMIVGVNESSFEFLGWEEIKWYDTSYIQLDISHVTDIIIESPDYNVKFEIEDSVSRYMTYIARNGSTFTETYKDEAGKEYSIQYAVRKDALTGNYVLTGNSKRLTPVYDGDFLITPLIYTKGTAAADNYLFYETKAVDLDEDGNNDANTYYFYNVVYNNGEYYLATVAYMADNSGNKLTNDTSVMGKPYMSTEYFITNSGYIYLTNRDSYLGSEIDRMYGDKNRGSWHEGNFFVTADNKYVLVNSKTGEWSIINDISCGIYFADKETSRLAQRAVHIPAVYNSSGKILRHEETYYPSSSNKLRYDEDTNTLEIFNEDTKQWESASYSDCTIGIWCSGAYYASERGNIAVVNKETGDLGLATVSANETYVAEVIANGSLLDYNIKTTNHAQKVVNTSAMDNFKQFYGALLYASLEGMADLTDEEKAALRELDNFDDPSADNPCQLKITIYGVDLYGNRRDIVYRIYQYTERQSYITIEAISPDGESSSTTAYGNFYVLRSFADKIINDARRIVNAEEVTAISKN